MEEFIQQRLRKLFKKHEKRLTKELRTILKDIVYLEIEELSARLEELSPKERVEVLIKLMPYVFPKVDKASHTLDEPWEASW